MKYIALFVLLGAGGIYFAASQVSQAQTTRPSTQPAKVYSCPMHADVVSDKPGKCPKCGMNLEEIKKGIPSL